MSLPETDEPEPATSTSYETVLARTIEEGLSELERPSDGLFLSVLTAGLEMGTGLFLTGWLMGLLAWLVKAAQNDGTRTYFLVLITFGIAIAHLPHPIAGSVKVLLGAFATGGVSVGTYLTFFVTTVVGSAIGGAVFVGLLKYEHVVRSEDAQVIGSATVTESSDD